MQIEETPSPPCTCNSSFFEESTTQKHSGSSNQLLAHESNEANKLTQRVFMHSDVIAQGLFRYALEKSGASQIGGLSKECSRFCKHLQAQYSISCKESIIVRVKHIGDLHPQGVCQKPSCQHADGSCQQSQSSLSSKNQPQLTPRTDENAILFYWITKLMEEHPTKFSQSDIHEINQIMTIAKTYFQCLQRYIKQIKIHFELLESRLYEISNMRVDSMRKTAHKWMAENLSGDHDFVMINYYSIDFNTERLQIIEQELNPAMLSLLGTHSEQYSKVILRNGVQRCSRDTQMTDLIFNSIKSILLSKETEVEFNVQGQRIVLIDSIVTTCDVHGIRLQNQWDQQVPFVVSNNEILKQSFETVMILKIMIPPEQIKEILDIRMVQKSLEVVSQKESSIPYAVQCELFCEKFYPEMNLGFTDLEANKSVNRVCNFKQVL